ncbi:hypothetical protein [Zhihengliuella sp. ISTPL4]|uniref:hypothetical protein n=1 Tax=Zhihengliuella sp. ISTPL4 TaxID=2058657 RepID=UPI000C7DA137|nr:hypothetical protein [Zhihengliuella sp. ISTPL4]
MAEHETVQGRLATLVEEDPSIWLVSDDSDTVSASVDADGVLRTLRLAPSWWRRIPAQELGPVVLRLRQASAAARQNTIAELEDEGFVFATSDERPVPPIPSPDAESLDMSALRAELGTLLSGFAELRVYREAVRSATAESSVLRSPSGNVSMELVGGAPRALTIDPTNVQFVSEQALAGEIIELFERARGWLGERRASLLRDLPDLAGVVNSVRDAR